MNFALRVQRQGIDPTAESSLHALRDLMRLPVLAVEHAALWQIDVGHAPDLAAARRALEKAACRAGRYVNINRDAMIWDADDSTRPAPQAGCAVDVWVTQGDGRDARALQWFRQYSGVDCHLVRRGRWFRVHVHVADPEQAQRCVEDLATSRTRHAGLLANPHSDSVAILRVRRNPGQSGQPLPGRPDPPRQDRSGGVGFAL
jgi:hypothetical protein